MDIKKIGYLLVGLLAGFSSAALGIGGGVTIVPSLVIFFGFDVKKAIGTSLATIVLSAFIGSIAHYLIKNNNMQFDIALFILMGSIVGAKFGSLLANRIKSKILTMLFALLLIFTGLKLVGLIQILTKFLTNSVAYPFLILLGLIAGSASALFGIGGGVIMVPVLVLFFGLTMHEAIPTSLAVIVPTSLAGTIFHKKFDNINMEAIKFMIPSALLCAILGAIVANRLPSATLKMIFGIFMILCSFRIFFTTHQGWTELSTEE